MRGSGTQADPFIIENLNDLQNMNNNRTAFYELESDIDASETVTWNGGLGFDPIGTFTGVPADAFSGSFDGKGFRIIGLVINRPLEDFIGLFGYTGVACGEIKNVGIENCTMAGDWFVGALVGFHEFMTLLADGNISNCWSSGSVTGAAAVGGLLGYNGALVRDCYSGCTCLFTSVGFDVSQCGGFVGLNDRNITRCYATGNITVIGNVGRDVQEVGGFAGITDNGEVTRCFATGNVIVNADGLALVDVWGFGGFCGANNFADVRNCYARGSVTVIGGIGPTQIWVGGFAGGNRDDIENCYSTGRITTTGMADVGGFVGDNYASGVVTNCFWDTETSGQAASDGGVGRTTAQMKDRSTFTAVGWNFTTIWNQRPMSNDRYPCLRGVTPFCTLDRPQVATLAATGVT